MLRAWRAPRVARCYAERPVAVQRMPDSLLDRKIERAPQFVGNRTRLSTCSGVVWIGSSRLVTVQLLRSVVHAYDFSPEDASFRAVEQADLQRLAYPENLAVSPNRRLLAISNGGNGSACLYRVREPGPAVEPEPIARIHNPGDTLTHGITFSACGRFLLLSTLDRPGCFRRYAVDDAGERVEIAPVEMIPNRLAPLKAKGMAYSPSGDLLAIAYGINASARPHVGRGHVDLHTVDPQGRISNTPVSRSASHMDFGCVEDVNFFPDGARLLVTDQEKGTASVIGVDCRTGALEEELVRLRPETTGIDFPHGCAIAPDGQHFAVTSYGTDTISVFRA